MASWEVKKDGETKCYGDTIKSMPDDRMISILRAGGYKIYVDGKLYKEQKPVRRASKAKQPAVC